VNTVLNLDLSKLKALAKHLESVPANSNLTPGKMVETVKEVVSVVETIGRFLADVTNQDDPAEKTPEPEPEPVEKPKKTK